MKSVVVTTGGTGGHIFPALAVAEEIRRRHPGCALTFIGGTYGPEADLAAKAGVDFLGLPVRGVLGRGLAAAGAAAGLMKAVFKAKGALRRVRPQVVVGFGGYASVPAVTAAWMLGIPRAVHEQNAIPGLANKLTGRMAQKIFLSMEDRHGVFASSKSLLTGNPVRASIAALHGMKREGARTPGRLLIMGGSLGARALNRAVMADLHILREAGVKIRHQTGEADLPEVRAAYRGAGMDDARVDAFIDDMAQAYAEADLALCRAGATSIAELTAAGLPAVFVPFPYATHDHQLHNARQMEGAGAALVMEQKDLAHGLLGRKVSELLRRGGELAVMSRAAAALARPDAAGALVDELEKLI